MLSCVRLFATPWTVALPAPLSMGILQVRILQWVAMPSSRGIFPTQVSCTAGGLFTIWATREAQEYWMGSLFLLQVIFLTQESNQGLLHCRGILYQLSYQVSPNISILQYIVFWKPNYNFIHSIIYLTKDTENFNQPPKNDNHTITVHMPETTLNF